MMITATSEKKELIDFLLQKIASHLIINGNFCPVPGLNGKTGAVIFLLNYASTSGNEYLKFFGEELTEEVLQALVQYDNVDYLNGISGIASSFKVLKEAGLLNKDIEGLLDTLRYKALRPSKQLDFLSGLLGQTIYLSKNLPAFTGNWQEEKKYLSSYTFILDALRIIQDNFKQLYGRFAFESSRETFNPIKEEGSGKYFFMLYNLSKLWVMVQQINKVNIDRKRTESLQKDIAEITDAFLHFHLIKRKDYFHPQTDEYNKLQLLHLLLELLNCKLSEENHRAGEKTAILLQQAETAITQMLSGLNFDRRRVDAIIDIALVLHAMSCRYHVQSLGLLTEKCIQIIVQMLTHAVSGNLSTLNNNIGLFYGWSKVGLLLHSYLHREDKYQKWQSIFLHN